ncbi:MAG: hypothetical protein KF718_00490 [Polyangiaceae bacterium]|nr:hypothetical protein [Polyangiaceae bacterium]
MDAKRGDVVVGSERFGSSTTPADVVGSSVRWQPGERLPDHLEASLALADGRAVLVTLLFTAQRLRGVALELAGDAHPLEGDRSHILWLAESLGPPHFGHARGATWSYPWGSVYVFRGGSRVMFTGARARVPLPVRGGDAVEHTRFRCLSCGEVTLLPYSSGVLEAGMDRGAVPCEACGWPSWVQVGTMTEYQRWSKRDEICEVGQHAAEGVRRFALLPKHPAVEQAALRPVERLLVKACPEHVSNLRRDGVLGFYLPDDD